MEKSNKTKSILNISLFLAVKQMKIDYYIGSGEQRFVLAEVTQFPDCGLSIESYSINNMSGPEDIEATIAIDAESSTISIDCSDYSFASQTATFDLSIV